MSMRSVREGRAPVLDVFAAAFFNLAVFGYTGVSDRLVGNFFLERGELEEFVEPLEILVRVFTWIVNSFWKLLDIHMLVEYLPCFFRYALVG